MEELLLRVCYSAEAVKLYVSNEQEELL